MTQTTQDQVNQTAWAACDTFRGVVDAGQYKGPRTAAAASRTSWRTSPSPPSTCVRQG